MLCVHDNDSEWTKLYEKVTMKATICHSNGLTLISQQESALCGTSSPSWECSKRPGLLRQHETRLRTFLRLTMSLLGLGAHLYPFCLASPLWPPPSLLCRRNDSSSRLLPAGVASVGSPLHGSTPPAGTEWRRRRVPLHRCRVEERWPGDRERQPQTTGETGTRQGRDDGGHARILNDYIHVLCFCVYRFATASSMGWEPNHWGSKWGWRRMMPPAT